MKARTTTEALMSNEEVTEPPLPGPFEKSAQAASIVLPSVAIGDPAGVRFIPYIAGPGYEVRQEYKNSPQLFKSTITLFFVAILVIFLCQFSTLVSNFALVTLLSVAGLLASATFALVSLRDSIIIDSYSIRTPMNIAHLHELISPRGRHDRSVLFFSELVDLAIVEGRVKQGQHRFILHLIAKNSGYMDVELKSITRENLIALVRLIEMHAPHCKNLSQLAELPKFHDFQNDLLPNLSYTKLWESLYDKKFELTGFTPLAPETHLQSGFLTVKQQIASGGFSAVYLCQGNDEVTYVLKESVLPFGIDEKTKEKAVEHFEREAKLLRTLDHPRIAHVRDHFAENGRNYLLLEHVPGTTLRQLINQSGSQPEERVRRWLVQIAEVVSYLHNRTPPIIHRDLTPDNMIVRDDDKLFLIDFGAANEFVGSATGTLVGKHAYMSPEQIRGKAEPASDYYALGGTIYFCLAGADPEPIRSSSPRAAGCAVSDLMEQLVSELTSLDPHKRDLSLLKKFEQPQVQLVGHERGNGNGV
jgi:tRNA A-37 threonylcarbamoyl transferase component Bud32